MKKLLAALAVVTVFAARPIAQSAPSAPSTPSSPGTDIVGTWDITTNSPIGEQTNAMVVSKEGDGLKAVAKGDAGELPYDKVEQTGSAVKIILTVDFQGTPMIITYTGKADAKTMSGDADFGGLAQGTWSAVRK